MKTKILTVSVIVTLVSLLPGCQTKSVPHRLPVRESVASVCESEMQTPDDETMDLVTETEKSTVPGEITAEQETVPEETVVTPSFDVIQNDDILPESDPAESVATPQLIPPETRETPAPAKETEKIFCPEPTALPDTEEPVTEDPPGETEQPKETETTAPEFDIDYWISFARNYAVGVGLNLDDSATDCWDNPLIAGSQSKYLERDISGILDKYSRDEDITDVWIWAEPRSDGNYDLFIGYA